MEGSVARQRFLVADDDRRLAETVARIVETVSPAIVVHNGRDALTRSSTELWIGVVLDVGLGEDDGFEVLKALRARDPIVPVLMLTGMLDPVLINRAFEMGAAYVCKPLRREAVVQFAQQAWVKNSGGAPELARTIHAFAQRYQLSTTEMFILTRSAQGFQRGDIIEERGVSANTHRSQVSSLLQKMQAKSLTDAANSVLRAMLEGRLLPTG